MNLHLCISVTFLDPLFHGWGDEEPEWPPSPMRLFQALLAGARTGCRGVDWNGERKAAFRWLESPQRQPPLVIAPVARRQRHHESRSGRYTLFVPNNDSDRKPDRQDRLASKVAWPHVLLDGRTIHFAWPIEDGGTARARAEVLCREARSLLALGWGIDQVAGNGLILTDRELAALPGERWRGWSTHRPGAQTWRVPTDGSLAELEEVHQSFLRRIEGKKYYPPTKVSRFDVVNYTSASTPPPRSYAVFELAEGFAFRPESAAAIAAMLRSLTYAYASADTHAFPQGAESYVVGRITKQEENLARFSYLPLPTIGHEHADGMIRRVLIAEPVGTEGLHARWARGRLRNATLRDGSGGDCGMLLDPWRPRSCSILRRYCGTEKTWCSVTPVILPGSDDRRHGKAEKLILVAIDHAGIPISEIECLALRKVPFWRGARHAERYRVPEYLRRYGRWHLHLVFKKAMSGPVAIGAGRHVGLGLLACSDSAATSVLGWPDPRR